MTALVTVARSGAKIIHIGGGMVLKIGDDAVGARIGEQAAWLMHNAGSAVVPVTPIAANAYMMRECREWMDDWACRDIFDRIVERAMSHIWCRAPFVRWVDPVKSFDEKLFHLKARVGNELLNAAYKRGHSLVWGALPQCLTHGDMTFENTMWLEERLVFIDPIPSGAIPDIRAVDLGKLLQSCMGWDRDFGKMRYEGSPSPDWVREICANDNEWKATIACCVLHFLRIFPYATDDEKERLRPIILEVLKL